MLIKNCFKTLLISMLVISCKTDYNFKINAPNKINTDKKLTISFEEKGGAPIDSVQVTLKNKRVELDINNRATIDISNFKLGHYIVTALAFYEQKTIKVTKTIEILADSPPAIYTFKVINSYPHDKTAYTQGLEIHNGFLYESTGKYGTSSLRKVELKTGKVIQQIDLDKQYFGEGFTKFGDEIFMLTWKKGIGFIYDFETFEQKGTFNYKNSIEGWGLTNNGENLIKTDGTERIWFLDPTTKKELRYIEAYTNKRKVEKLNELEYIDGKIYANIWMQDSLLILDAETGKVEGIADLRGLKNKVEQHSSLDVLNGIAYDQETKKLYVTGKNWSKLFEIELIKK